jgi:hypothetical protein
MNDLSSTQEKQQQKIQLWIYLLPIVGLLPSIWTLARHQGDRQQQATSRLAISLLLIWLGTYTLLSLGTSQTSELVAFRLLYTNALLTTGYFSICIILMLRLRQGKSPRLPLISKFTDTILRKDRS